VERPEMKKKKSDEGGAAASSLARVREKRKNVQPPRVFCCPFNCKIPPPLCLSCGPVFIGKMLHGSQNWSLNFLSFFVNLIFLNFFVFFENEQYQRRLNEENQ
jgi:hypothetical protein